MSQSSFRVRTQVGKDKKVTFELKQDFDLLEILSLSLTQQEVYTRMCADFGVVVGRVIANGGYGVPNAKVSIFVPLDREDEDNPVIRAIYPYKEVWDLNDDGKRYNLLSSDPNFSCHVPIGSFPSLPNILADQDVEYVFNKYYKFTAKTNESGDFMIYGVPIGQQSVVMDIDLSDIGCFSLLPEDFKNMGYSPNEFDGARFKTNDSIDALPQLINQQKSIDVRPFWGDEEACRASITRVDFDLGNSGFKLQPNSVFMGSIGQDTDKDSVNMNCRPRASMGELCSLITKPGIIDAIRYTPFLEENPNAFPAWDAGTDSWDYSNPIGGTVPVLERHYLSNGGRVIDSNGAFLVHMPMNLDHLITDEFGDLVKSGDPDVGVPTRARYRFRVRPEKATGGARFRRVGSYLVPNIHEFTTQDNNDGDWPGIDKKSYTFSTDYADYHPWAQRNLLPGADDYFYEMTFNRVYTFAQFHDHVKHGGRRQFVGIKNILPEQEQQCSTTAMFFPINSAVRQVKFIIFLNTFIIGFLGMLFMIIDLVVSILAVLIGTMLAPILIIIFAICKLWCAIWSIHISLWGITILNMSNYIPTPPKLCSQINLTGFGCGEKCEYFGIPLGFILFKLRQTKYPECEKCLCRPNTNAQMIDLANNFPCPGDPPTTGGTNNGSPCPVGNGSLNTTIGGNFQHDCCEPTDDTYVCCGDNYGYNSAVYYDGQCAPQPETDGTAGIAGGGCYIKVICFNPACLFENLNMVVFRQWARREKMASALCNGVMNYYWENNWVSGFLYMFQFNAKLEFEDSAPGYPDGTYATKSKYCKKLTYLHPDDNTFFYRSTPFRTIGPSKTDGQFIGDTDGVYSPWWSFNGNGSSNNHADGDMDRHILFPTTMVDMGSRNQCIQQICLDTNFSEDCSVTDQIGSTTFQDITDLVMDIYNIKLLNDSSSISTFYPRPEMSIGGDVGQALMQNCMLGVYGYEANIGNTQCKCDYDNNTMLPNDTTVALGGLEYPEPNFDITTWVDHAVNASCNKYYPIQWEPLLFTGQTETIMDAENLIECITLELSAATQVVPFYAWETSSNNTNPLAPGFGSDFNDWMYTKGEYVHRHSMNAPGMSTVPSLFYSFQEDIHVPSGLSWPLGGPGAGGYIQSVGLFQNDMGKEVGFTHPNSYPVMTSTSDKQMVFSQPLFYYFGLRPGNTSFNIFVRKYIDEELADGVI